MKKAGGTLFFFLLVAICSAQSHKGFRWIGKEHKLYKIDIQTGQLNWDAPGKPVFNAGKIQGWDSLRKEIPGDFEVIPHYFGDSLIITIPGTGQVYQLIDSSLTLNRLDRTFFRGFNFNANQFVRKDTIFSIGGEGFWQKHSIITFYDPKNLEWSLYKEQNFNPYSTKDVFSGYSPAKDVFFSANISTSFFQDTTNVFLSVFDFKTRKWQVKGELDQELIKFLRNNFKSVWTGDYLLIYNDNERDKVFVLDPFNNVKYIFQGPNDHFFLGISELYAKNGYLYSRDITSSGLPDKKGLDSVSISSIISSSIKNGKVYTKPGSVFLYVIPVLVILFGMIIWLMWNRKRKMRTCPLSLSELEVSTVKEFIHHPDKKFTTLEVNALLQIEKKTYDNQRQIRNRIIGNINQQFLTILENKELICRSPNAEDKRMMEYFVNPEIKGKEIEKIRESLVTNH